MSHTPAPWFIVDNVPEAAIGYRAIVDAEGTTICNPSPMGEANARLIAAAPDLLTALNATFKALLLYEGPEEKIERVIQALNTAHAAINRATKGQR